MITKEKYNKVISSYDEFNSFIEELKREIFLAIPEIILKHIQDVQQNKLLVEQFYKENPELKENRFLIGQLANKIAAKNPGLSVEEVFSLTASKAKKALGEQDGDKTNRLKRGKL